MPKMISIEYEVSENGNIIDSNKKGVPLEFVLGAGQVISGLEDALMDKNIGDVLSLTIAPKDAYGEYQSELIQEISREQFKGIELKEGMTLFGQSEDGQSAQVIVKGFNDENVIIDYNHPLAGSTLHFEVKVLNLREVSEDEVIKGHSCSCADSHHGRRSGCCGGGGCSH